MLSQGKRIVKRRAFLSLLGLAAAGLTLTAQPAQAFLFESEEERAERRRRRARNARKKQKAETKKNRKTAARKKLNYKGREVVEFRSSEKPGTIIVKTGERALYQVMPDGKAMRYLVAVGKDGFAWSGVARVGMKRKNPTWTPPAEMIKRTPKYAKWKNGMPGGIPENPLGARALYLFDGGGDTMYRIHGTNAPSSIGTAASSGCIRMLNKEVVELFNSTPVGTKVIVKQ
jgi:lipoprotein-anchoring transpeptidase ErfK/SrfK